MNIQQPSHTLIAGQLDSRSISTRYQRNIFVGVLAALGAVVPWIF